MQTNKYTHSILFCLVNFEYDDECGLSKDEKKV